MCPVGVATQDEKLRERLHIDAAAKRVENYLRCSAEELKTRVYAICRAALRCIKRIAVFSYSIQSGGVLLSAQF